MYGLYKERDKYFVQIRNMCNKKKLITQNGKCEMLNRIAKNLNTRIPLMRLSATKNCNDVNAYKLKCNLGLKSNFQTLPNKDISTDKLLKQNNILFDIYIYK
ncbi:uncharacterized protein LOC105431959 [Pogonomyrmex barbatus]|uniref:Uncharacterized protein LOC105431959 n=1 Tax=Pogonomyrmex barbatus TaxID=144034 RepID=A0A6I9WMW3_9HYME|nr:uncharacterized protein LOC105431959 [Pogonomyrmex barbatus]